MEKWKLAVDDCTVGINCPNVTNNLLAKLCYRKGLGEKQLSNVKAAKSSFQQGLEADPENELLKKELSALVWSEKKSARSNREKQRPGSSVKSIPINVVESLPERFSAVLNTASDPITSAPEPRKISGTFEPPTEPLTLFTLTQLMRAPELDLPQVYDYILSIQPNTMRSIHGSSGINYDVIDFVLDAILYKAKSTMGIGWVQNSVELIRSMSECPRFGIAKVFANTAKIKEVLEALKSRTSSQLYDEVRKILI